MTDKEIFLASAIEESEGKNGNFDFSCPLCSGYSMGTRQSWFGSIIASCMKCDIVVRGSVAAEIREKGA